MELADGRLLRMGEAMSQGGDRALFGRRLELAREYHAHGGVCRDPHRGGCELLHASSAFFYYERQSSMTGRRGLTRSYLLELVARNLPICVVGRCPTAGDGYALDRRRVGLRRALFTGRTCVDRPNGLPLGARSLARLP